MVSLNIWWAEKERWKFRLLKLRRAHKKGMRSEITLTDLSQIDRMRKPKQFRALEWIVKRKLFSQLSIITLFRSSHDCSLEFVSFITFTTTTFLEQGRAILHANTLSHTHTRLLARWPKNKSDSHSQSDRWLFIIVLRKSLRRNVTLRRQFLLIREAFSLPRLLFPTGWRKQFLFTGRSWVFSWLR